MIVYRIGTRFNAKAESKVAYTYERGPEYYKYISQLSTAIIPTTFRLGTLQEVE